MPSDAMPKITEQMLQAAEKAYVRGFDREQSVANLRDVLRNILSAALSVPEPKCSACNGTGFVMGDGGAESNCGKCTAPAVDLMQNGKVDAALFRFAATWRDDTVATRVVNARKLMQTILAALSVVPVEPYAWVRNVGTLDAEWTTDKERGQAFIDQGYPVTLLYDHPVAASPRAAEPTIPCSPKQHPRGKGGKRKLTGIRVTDPRKETTDA